MPTPQPAPQASPSASSALHSARRRADHRRTSPRPAVAAPLPPPRPRRRTGTTAHLGPLTGLLAAVCALGGCIAAPAPAEPPTGAPTAAQTLVWPTAVDPAAATGTLWVVWTAVAADASDPTLTTAAAELGALGFTASPWPASCQDGAQEVLSALTGTQDPTGVGVAFASAQDAGVFDTLYDGTTVSLTEGAYTCG